MTTDGNCPDCDVPMVSEKYEPPARGGKVRQLIRQRCPKCSRIEHPKR